MMLLIVGPINTVFAVELVPQRVNYIDGAYLLPLC